MLGAVIALCWWWAESARPWLGPILLFWAAAGIGIAAVMPTWRYRVHRWEITGAAVYTLSGWFVRQWRIVPISRIQSIDTVRGPLQQALGLATLSVMTASRQGSIRISGISVSSAAEASQELTDLTEAVRGDAT